MTPLEPIPVLKLLALGALALPAAAFLGLGLAWLLGLTPSERATARTAALAFGGALACSLALALAMALGGRDELAFSLGAWFGAGEYAFELSLLVDRLTVPFMVLTTGLLGLVGLFSVRYLHREPGFTRFFLLLLLFGAGMLLLTMAGTIQLLFVGWELVGVSSALLIAYFRDRREPLRNALVAFATYRVCDVGLLVAAILAHHAAGQAGFASLFPGSWPGEVNAAGAGHTALALCLVFAAMGKSAQVPFSGWLPRAMEGPTPSSAIFYGALSVHAGAYLLLRTAPLLEQSPLAAAVLVAVGLLTALHGTFVGRVQTDIKSELAYASLVQVGLILAEVGLGFRMLALVHIVGHALLRTLQLLRAPSLLHERHQLERLWGDHLPGTGAHLELLVPARARGWLYWLALQRGHHETLLEWYLVRPALAALRRIERLERRLLLGPGPAAVDVPAEAEPEVPVLAPSPRVPEQAPASEVLS